MWSYVETISALTALLLVPLANVGAQECRRLRGASPAELTSYLDGTLRVLR